jgi:hypothetical protein
VGTAHHDDERIEGGGNRTHDLRLKRPLLYRLSYTLSSILAGGHAVDKKRIDCSRQRRLRLLLVVIIIGFVGGWCRKRKLADLRGSGETKADLERLTVALNVERDLRAGFV